MAANSDGHTELTTVVTCEGDLSDPRFPAQLNIVVGRLNGILGDKVKVRKLEPWNSVRVTLSIPREAALRLRQLANEGSQQLRALGILSVQVEGDQVISLRLATSSVNSEPQEIVLRTVQDGGSNDLRETDLGLSSFLSTTSGSATASSNSQVQFKSPNVVCPHDSVVPKVGNNSTAPNNVSNSGKAFAGPFPFASMNQAIHSNREPTPFNSLPPPYPGKHPPVTISSPLLVNLLQNDGPKESGNVSKLPPSVASARSIRTPPVSVNKTVTSTVTVSATPSNPTLVKPNPTSTQANVLVNNSISPSALSTNTSIRQNSTILTSTTVAVNKTPPPQYHRALPASMAVKQQQPPIGFSNTPNVASTIPQMNSLAQSNNHLSQNSLPIPQSSNTLHQVGHHIQQPNVFQAQTQSKNPLTQTSGGLPLQQTPLLTQNSLQPNLTIPQTKTPLPPPNIKPPLMQANMVLPPQKNFSISQVKNPALNSVLPQVTNNSNVLGQTKNSLPQGASIPKHPNNFHPQAGKNLANNFSQPNVLNVTVPQASTIPPAVTLPSHLSSVAVPTTALSNPTETISNAGNIRGQSQPVVNTIIARSMPSPPPYSVAISRPWDTLVHSHSLMDLTPSFTDLKPDDLDEILPSLERELTHSPLPELPEDFLSGHSNIMMPAGMASPVEDKRKFLVNPLTGELEPQSSSESDTEELKDVFTGLPSPAALSDDDTSSTIRPDAITDHSDSETRSSDTTKPPRLKNSKIRDRGRDSPALKQEKIKLRLKLEKSEPINPAYKVDVSFINTQPKKASASVIAAGEELRVPPLHISLRGRNSVVIKNKNKLNPDGTPMKPKVRKNQEHVKIKKSDGSTVAVSEELVGSSSGAITGELSIDQMKVKAGSLEQKKFKKFKAAHDKDIVASLTQESDLKSKFIIHNHYKEKQKERRGSDSELVRNNKKYIDSNGVICDEKKRRLSQAEQVDGEQPTILGSTNVGTIMGLPQKPRKDKVKIKDVFKKDVSRNKIFSKSLGDKLQAKQVTLPTAGEMNMEAKFKQGLLEGTAEKVVVRPPHRTEVVNHISAENNATENTEKVTKAVPETTTLKDKSPEPDKCNTPDRKSVELGDKPPAVTGGRSPNSGAGQGEDSGIESMDALSEKSPNQASQSPHADILPPKTQVPTMLDIEAQLAKMEGLNGDTDRGGGVGSETPVAGPTEDVNENKCHHDQSTNLKQCCELTCALQDSLKQGTVTLSTALTSPTLPSKQQAEVSLVPLKMPEIMTGDLPEEKVSDFCLRVYADDRALAALMSEIWQNNSNVYQGLKIQVKKEDDLEPLPVRVTPALYTYSNPNPEKSRGGSESPALSDEDSNSCSTNSTVHNSKQNRSLLEQLLIEIPNDHQTVPSSPSPATRSSVRTRALSKLGSPELSSPVTKNTRTMPTTKRKRNESDSSNQSLDETRKKPRKVSDTPLEIVKNRHNEPNKANNIKKGIVKMQQDESSDSDEPLIEKLRKPVHAVNTQANNVAVKAKVKSVTGTTANNNKAVVMNTRRSVRSTMPAQNTRSKGDKIQSESEALRRKTRSAVSDVENKRKKEVK